MTVQSQTSFVGYDGPGSVFAIPFRFLADTDIRITKALADGTSQTLVLTTDYTLVGARQQSGGTATLVVALLADERIVIDRGNMQLTQLTDYRANDPFPEEAAEDIADRGIMLLQQGLLDGSARSLRLSPVDIDGDGSYLGNGNRIVDIAEAVDPTDVPNLAQVTGLIGPGSGPFIQSGTGAIIRTYQDKDRERVSAQDFGAVGDGVTNDRTAIVNALAATADEVMLLEGDYLITGAPITIPAGKRLIGNGGLISSAGTTPVRFIRPGGANYSFFVLEAGAELRNVWLGPSDGVTPSSGRCIDIQASGCIVSDIIVEKCWDGIYLQNVAGAYFQRTHVGGWENAGFNFDGNNADVFLTESILNGATSAGTGVRLHNKIEAFIMTSCDVIGGGAGLTTSASGAMVPSDRLNPNFNKISDCYFDSSAAGVTIDKSCFLTFTACWFASSQLANGVTVLEAWETTFQGCEFFNNYGNGASLASTQRGTKFIGCRFINNDASVSGSAGLLVNNNVTNWSAVNCTFNNSVYPSGPQQDYGIFIGTGVDRFSVLSCNFGTHSVAKLADNSAPSADKYIAENAGFRTSNSFQTTAPGGSTSHFVNHNLDVTPVLSDVQVIANADPGTRYWVGAVTATQVGIGFQAALGGDVAFSVSVRAKGA